MSASVSTLGDSGWLIHVQSVLAGSAWIAARVAMESSSVLVHCRFGFLGCLPLTETCLHSRCLGSCINCFSHDNGA